jgi:transcriptional regulator with XRE-family HTH domain
MSSALDSFDLETFGGRISYALSISDKSQSDVARFLDVARSSISGLCRMQKPRTASRNVPEIAKFLGVSNDWLAYGMGEVPKPETIGRFEEEPSAPANPVRRLVEKRNSKLTDLQAAALGKLELLMVSGVFDDMDALELLTTLKPKLTSLSLLQA